MTLQALFEHLRALPPIPRVVQEVLARTSQDANHDSELAKLIAADQIISARLLQVANSARYQMPQQINTVSQAMQVLGLVNVRTLVVSLGLISGFQQLAPALQQPLWRFNLHTAALARQGASAAGVDAELAYTLGLLQGIGQMVMQIAQPERMLPLNALSNPLAPERPALEQQVLGYDYTEVSAELARRWQFPPLFAQVLQAVGRPLAADLPDDVARLVALIQVSVWQAWAATQGALSAEQLASWPQAAAQRIGLPIDAAQHAIAPLPVLCPALHELMR